MRISDWSSDVCSSDLEDAAVRTDDRQDLPVALQHAPGAGPEHQGRRAGGDGGRRVDAVHHLVMGRLAAEEAGREQPAGAVGKLRLGRSEERRVGKECDSTCRSRWWPYA